MAASAANDDEDDSTAAEAGGFAFHGGKAYSERMPSGLTAIKEQRILHKAIREGWLKQGRWPTEATPSELRAKQQERGELTLKEQAAAAAALDMPLSLDDIAVPDDPEVASAIRLAYRRLRQMTVRNLVAMERQNQADDLMALRLQADGENAQALSSSMLEAIISQCLETVAEAVGPERAHIVHARLAERLTIEGARRGTSRTPDMDVMDMDATIPGPPAEA